MLSKIAHCLLQRVHPRARLLWFYNSNCSQEIWVRFMIWICNVETSVEEVSSTTVTQWLTGHLWAVEWKQMCQYCTEISLKRFYQHMLISVFSHEVEERYDTECVFTWYYFRGLNLHKALFDEGVSEKLAHARLQAKDGLAGGRLREETHTIKTLSHKQRGHYHTWSDSLDSLHNHNRCAKTRLPVFFFFSTCTFCLLQGWNIHLLAKARPAFRPRKSLGNLKPIIINVKAESWEGSKLLQVNPEITVKI